MNADWNSFLPKKARTFLHNVLSVEIRSSFLEQCEIVTKSQAILKLKIIFFSQIRSSFLEELPHLDIVHISVVERCTRSKTWIQFY